MSCNLKIQEHKKDGRSGFTFRSRYYQVYSCKSSSFLLFYFPDRALLVNLSRRVESMIIHTRTVPSLIKLAPSSDSVTCAVSASGSGRDLFLLLLV